MNTFLCCLSLFFLLNSVTCLPFFHVSLSSCRIMSGTPLHHHYTSSQHCITKPSVIYSKTRNNHNWPSETLTRCRDSFKILFFFLLKHISISGRMKTKIEFSNDSVSVGKHKNNEVKKLQLNRSVLLQRRAQRE